MDASKPASAPGSADLQIGGAQNALRRNSALRPLKQGAILENGAPTAPTTAAWHSRGYIPHFESAEATQHVTFHLADSLPKAALQRLEAELKFISSEKRDAERRKRIDSWIDAGHGSCVLREPRIAHMVQASLLAFDSKRYRLLAWVVMPNHVHVLFQPMNGWTVAKIVASWKKFTGRRIESWERQSPDWRQLRDPPAPVWQREYWDRYIRDERHLTRTIEYIHMNPVKAGLVAKPKDWLWSSATPGSADLQIGVLDAKR
jgi:REP-associated tyrosine transposase